jgi:hypothetical protein
MRGEKDIIDAGLIGVLQEKAAKRPNRKKSIVKEHTEPPWYVFQHGQQYSISHFCGGKDGGKATDSRGITVENKGWFQPTTNWDTEPLKPTCVACEEEVPANFVMICTTLNGV